MYVYCNYEKVVLVGGFNAKIGETCLHNFLFQHELQSINKEPTCFKNAHNPSCTDFILTNSLGSFIRRILYLLDYQIFINWPHLYLKQHLYTEIYIQRFQEIQ